MRRPRLTGSALTPVAALLLVGCGAATPPSPPEPLAPKPKSVPTCTPPLVASTGLTKDVTVDMTTTLPATGMVTGKTVTLNGPLKLSRSLTVVADGDVTVTGKLTVEGDPTAGTPSDLTLVSLHGTVNVAAGAHIDGGSPDGARSSKTDNLNLVTAQGSPGVNGGYLKVVGVNVGVAGIIDGFDGGEGGGASAVSKPGSATAVGGSGGFGGDLLICGKDSIGVKASGAVHGSAGGTGGRVDATSETGSSYARGGDAGRPGTVTFSVWGLTGMVSVFFEAGATIRAGAFPFFAPYQGGDARASAGQPASGTTKTGGSATAIGGLGWAGATVVFSGTKVQDKSVPVSSDAGRGGYTQAMGGRGAEGRDAGKRNQPPANAGAPGGPADATGGNGGKPPPVSTYTRLNGTLGKVMRGTSGKGGNATATGGNGGSGGAAAPVGQPPAGGPSAEHGAQSGTSTALGGANGSGAKATTAHSDGRGPQKGNCQDDLRCIGGEGQEVKSQGA